MKICILLLALVGYVAADGCTNLHRLLVKQQWAQAFSEGASRTIFGQDMWNRMFKEAPDARAKFFSRVRGDNVYSPEFTAHAMRVLGGLDMCVSLLDDQATLDAEMAHLKTQHATRAIPDSGWGIFKRALFAALAQHLQRFEQDAWDPCFDSMANNIK